MFHDLTAAFNSVQKFPYTLNFVVGLHYGMNFKRTKFAIVSFDVAYPEHL